VHLRRSRGKDIDAACGQLAIKEEAKVWCADDFTQRIKIRCYNMYRGSASEPRMAMWLVHPKVFFIASQLKYLENPEPAARPIL
jgi:hypothetical protein